MVESSKTLVIVVRFRCKDHWKGWLSVVKVFESVQDVLRIAIYSEYLQTALTLENSRSVEIIAAVKRS
jgi:hypothetical protein